MACDKFQVEILPASSNPSRPPDVCVREHAEQRGEDRTMKTTRTRVYESPKLRTKRLAGIPVPILAIIAISMVVAATIVALGPYSAPKSQTAMTLFVGVG